MAHAHSNNEKLELGPGATPIFLGAAAIGVLGLVGALAASLYMSDDGVRRFYFAYLWAFAFFLSLSVGGLFFLLVTNVTRTGWSVVVRRVPEALARVFPLFLVLALPLLYPVIEHKGNLFRWAQPVEEHHGEGHGDAHGEGHADAASGHATEAAAPTEKAAGPTEKTVAAAEKAVAAAEASHTQAGHAHGDSHAAAHATPAEVGPAGYDTIKLQGQPGDRAKPGEATLRHAGVPAPLNNTALSGSHSPLKALKYVINPSSPLNEAGKPEAPDELVKGKVEGPFSFFLLNRYGFVVRVLVCLTALTLIAGWYVRSSARQDQTGDESLSFRLGKYAAPLLVVFGFSVTFLAYDLLMSLDPVFYSTIFGAYYFAGSAISVMALTILICRFLQSRGYLTQSIGIDHYHDLSKFQFAFTFFWGYLAFSQFMLLWYSSQPESLGWLARRGASTAAIHLETSSAWTVVTFFLLAGKLLIPFAGLLSRHVKRNGFGMIFWAFWILVFHALDLFWIVMPELTGAFHFGIPEIAAFLGIGGLFTALVVRGLAGAALRPLKDPRLEESLHFHQAF